MAKTCNGCKDNQTPSVIPYVAHESIMSRLERQLKRLWIALIVAIIIIFACNAIWLYSWLQYDYTSEEITYQQDGQGTNIIGDSNEVNNGAESNNTETGTH